MPNDGVEDLEAAAVAKLENEQRLWQHATLSLQLNHATLSLGGLAARRTSSSAHRVSTSYKCAQLGDSLRSVYQGATRRTGSSGMAKPRRHAAMHQREGGRIKQGY